MKKKAKTIATNKFKDFSYSFFVDKDNQNYKYVKVTYKYTNKNIERFVAIKKSNGRANIDYINEAKRVINNEIKNGELERYSMNYLHRYGKGPKAPLRRQEKILCVVCACAVAAVAIGLGSYYIYRNYQDATQPTIYHVKFDALSGGFVSASGKVTREMTIDVTPDMSYVDVATSVPNPVKVVEVEYQGEPIDYYYNFLGWSTNGIDVVDDFTFKIDSDMTLFAVYEEPSIHFINEGCSVTLNGTDYTNSSITWSDYNRLDYSFEVKVDDDYAPISDVTFANKLIEERKLNLCRSDESSNKKDIELEAFAISDALIIDDSESEVGRIYHFTPSNGSLAVSSDSFISTYNVLSSIYITIILPKIL